MILASRRARLYESIRTAHLERAHQLVDAAILYRVRRYDFDEALAGDLEIIQAGPIAAALLLRRSRLDAIEINEPLMTSSLPASALAVFAVRFGRRGRSPRIVTYAIGNANPFTAESPALKRRLRWRIEQVLARYVWNRVDAIAFGTPGSRDVYRNLLPSRDQIAEALIPALPARSAPSFIDRGWRIVFLGAFVTRKGLPLLIEAWPQVVAARPGATLTLVGKGTLLDAARSFAAAEVSVEVVVDPPRPQIRGILARSLLVVLPSQPRPTWREQVGLPIVEGLEQGCAIVTTDETGLADWLSEHGHSVVAADSDADALSAAIVAQIDAGDRSKSIGESLPLRDGRLAADEWMFGDTLQGVRGNDSHV